MIVGMLPYRGPTDLAAPAMAARGAAPSTLGGMPAPCRPASDKGVTQLII